MASLWKLNFNWAPSQGHFMLTGTNFLHHGRKIHFQQPRWRCSEAGSNRRLPICACHQWHSNWICPSCCQSQEEMIPCLPWPQIPMKSGRTLWSQQPQAWIQDQAWKGRLPWPIWMTWSLIRKSIAKIDWVIPPMAWLHGATKSGPAMLPMPFTVFGSGLPFWHLFCHASQFGFETMVFQIPIE